MINSTSRLTWQRNRDARVRYADGNPYWRRCRCIKYLYIYRNGHSRQISAKTRSWEKAEQQAHALRESLDPEAPLCYKLDTLS